MCYRIFKSVDRNNNGHIENIEVEIAIYQLYNIINKRLPGWQDPPSRTDIQIAFTNFDKDQNGTLDKDEFVEFSRGLVKNGPDMFFSRIGKDTITKTAVLPVATRGIQMGAGAAGIGAIAGLPLHIAAPLVGGICAAFRALVPAGL